VVLFGFIIFRADSLSFGLGFIAKMFTPSAFALGFADAWQHLTPYMIITIIAAVIGATPIVPFIKSKITAKGENAAEIISYVLTATLFFLCILILASDTYSPFIYFRF
jgi:alginate O-acetyltransferase complex protein AlgI